MFTACKTCKGWGLVADKELHFALVKCWHCGGKCIVDEETEKPIGDLVFSSDLSGLCDFDEFSFNED